MSRAKLPVQIPRHAWTGGDSPARGCMSCAERGLVREQFRANAREWSNYWGRPLPLDLARTFWRRARYDAYASVREYIRTVPRIARRDHRLAGMAARVAP